LGEFLATVIGKNLHSRERASDGIRRLERGRGEVVEMERVRRIWQDCWPVFVPRTFEVDRTIVESFREMASREPDRTALDFYGEELSYGRLMETIDGFSRGLTRLGVRKGDRVAVMMENCPQFVIAYFAALRIGGVVVSINPMLKHMEIEHELLDSTAETLVCLDFLYAEVDKVRDRSRLKHIILTSLHEYLPSKPIFPLPDEALQRRSPFPGTLRFQEVLRDAPGTSVPDAFPEADDLALLQYTGGTMGLPKGAMITHRALAYASVGATYWFNQKADDVYLGVTPFFHIMGMVQMMCAPLISGGKVVILARFVTDVVLNAIAHHRCTGWVGATTMLTAILNQPDVEAYDLRSFRYITSGGSPVTVDMQRKVKELAPHADIADGYGLTESVSHGGAVTPLGRFKPGYIGVPHLNDFKIVDLETGSKELAPNEEGEILIKGPALMKGYWNKPEETEKVLRDGWLHTGDIGTMDEEGYIRYVGRIKELIKCSGYSVFPNEVEELIRKHPAVAEVGVIGVADPYRGETPKAFIVLKTDYKGKIKAAEMDEWFRKNISAYKRPRFVEFREELPKSGAGKILRRILSEEEKRRGKEETDG